MGSAWTQEDIGRVPSGHRPINGPRIRPHFQVGRPIAGALLIVTVTDDLSPTSTRGPMPRNRTRGPGSALIVTGVLGEVNWCFKPFFNLIW